jgi:molybdopterin converting factor small subunit
MSKFNLTDEANKLLKSLGKDISEEDKVEISKFIHSLEDDLQQIKENLEKNNFVNVVNNLVDTLKTGINNEQGNT